MVVEIVVLLWIEDFEQRRGRIAVFGFKAWSCCMAKSNGLFITDGQLAERMGISADLLDTALPALSKAGFPQPDPLFAGRRYWPACEAFLDRRYGLNQAAGITAPPGLDGVENWG